MTQDLLASTRITRWDAWFGDENLAKDKRIEAAPHSLAAESAARAFLTRGKRMILDLACGIGRDTFCFEDHGLTVVGADASFNGLGVAQERRDERGAAAELVVADARHLPFRGACFDGVYCFGLLHEFTSQRKEQDVQDVMHEIRRLLKVGGVLVLTVQAGEPSAGLPKVQLFDRRMLDSSTKDLGEIEVRRYDDIGCTGRPDYHIWYGVFEK
jgi:ubiquinone/menaquinone biosynthesis C-methylase UbiE